MKVVLIKNYDTLGRIGDIKNVADGYAQNFLIPNKIVLPATGNNIERAEKMKIMRNEQKKIVTVDKKELAANLNNYTLAVREKADDNGTMFAGITRDKIADELTRKGHPIKSKQVGLSSPIKKVGSHKVPILFGPGVRVFINVDAQAE